MLWCVYVLTADDGSPFVSDDDARDNNSGALSRPFNKRPVSTDGIQLRVMQRTVRISEPLTGSGLTTSGVVAQSNSAQMKRCEETASVLAGMTSIYLLQNKNTKSE